MKNGYAFFAMLLSFGSLKAQDSTHPWRLSVGLDLGMISTFKITGTDTGSTNAFAMAPGISLGHKSGFSIGYSPKFFTGGLYMHAVSMGISQYDKSDYSYAATYSHYFFTGNKNVPYSPLTNEIYTSFTYKKPWLRPGITAGIGFGNNTQISPATSVYDVGASVGVSHSFDWESGDINFSAAPSISLSAGTNDYFSFLTTTKYIGNGSKSGKYVKNGSGSSNSGRGNGNGNGNSGSGGNSTTTTTTTAVPHKTFDLTNIELGLESSLETGNFTMRPELNLYIPVGNATGSGLSTYWQIALVYKL